MGSSETWGCAATWLASAGCVGGAVGVEAAWPASAAAKKRMGATRVSRSVG